MGFRCWCGGRVSLAAIEPGQDGFDFGQGGMQALQLRFDSILPISLTI